MVDRTVGRLNVQLGMDSARFESGVRKATAQTGKLEGRMKGLGTSVKGLAGLFAGALSVDFLVQETRNALAFADALGDAADKAGVSAEFLQQFRFVAEEFGGTMEGADAALNKFSVTLGKAQTGSKAQIAAFNALGVSVVDNEGKARSIEAVYRDVANSIAAIPNPSEQAARAQAIFGKGYAEIIGMLRQGGGEFDRQVARMRELGMVISNADVKALGDANREFEVIGLQLRNNFITAVAANKEGILVLIRSLGDLIGVVSRVATGFSRMYDIATNGMIAWRGMKFREAALKGDLMPDPMAPARGKGLRTNSVDPDSGRNFAPWMAPVQSTKPSWPKPPTPTSASKKPIRPIGAGGFGGMAAVTAFIDPQMLVQMMQQGVDGAERVAETLPIKLVPPFTATREAISREWEQLRADLEAETESILRELYPDEYQAQEVRDKIARLDDAWAAGLIDRARWAAARGRLAAELKALQVEIEKAQEEAGALFSSDELQKDLDKGMEEIARQVEETIGQPVKRSTAEVVADFATMAQGVLYELDSLGRSIKDGDFIGIMLGLVSLIDRIARMSKGGDQAVFPLGGMGGMGGFGRVPGFATGGAFTVGGSPGIDSNLVMFKATRGERVTVTRPGQSPAMGMGGLGATHIYDMRNSVVDSALMNQIRQEIQAGEARAITGGAQLALSTAGRRARRTF